MTIKPKRRLENISFDHEGAHVALVSKKQGGPANGVTTLVTKSVKDVSSEDIEKAQVRVTMDFEDFLCKFFGMWSDDAEVLATFLGMDTDEDEATEPQGYKSYIQNKVDQFELLKSLHDGKELTSLDAKEFIAVKKSQAALEPLILAIEKATKSKNKADYAYTPDDVPSHWKLNISDARHTSGAVAALGKGFRGKKVQIPESALAGVKSKVKSAYKKFFPDNPLPEILKSNEGVPNLETIEKSLHESIMQAEIEKAVSAANEKVEQLSVELKKANEKIEEISKAAEGQKMDVRKSKLAAVVNPEQTEELMKAVAGMDDAGFAAVLKSLEVAAKTVEKTDLFKEKGSDKGEPVTVNGTASILKSKYNK